MYILNLGRTNESRMHMHNNNKGHFLHTRDKVKPCNPSNITHLFSFMKYGQTMYQSVHMGQRLVIHISSPGARDLCCKPTSTIGDSLLPLFLPSFELETFKNLTLDFHSMTKYH